VAIALTHVTRNKRMTPDKTGLNTNYKYTAFALQTKGLETYDVVCQTSLYQLILQTHLKIDWMDKF